MSKFSYLSPSSGCDAASRFAPTSDTRWTHVSGDVLQIAGDVDLERASFDALWAAFPKTP
jgi:hypothetical protein